MIDFTSHSAYDSEIADLKQRSKNIDEAVESFKKLCEFQFHPNTPKQVLAPGKLHRVTQNDIWSLWKIELAVKGLRSNQSPRIWFAIKGTTIVLLSAQSHVDNYDDNRQNTVAIDRATDFF
jgi:hypothetical protein